MPKEPTGNQTKSFTVTMPTFIVDLLDEWASGEKRSRSNLVAVLLEQLTKLKYPTRTFQIRSIDQVINAESVAPSMESSPADDHWQRITDKRLRKEHLDTSDRAFLSDQGYTPEQIAAFEKFNGDTAHATNHV